MRLRFARRAQIDLVEIWKYVAQDRPATATEILRRIDERCRSLVQHPKKGRARPDIGRDIRSLVVNRWVILYRVEPGSVLIGRIVDGARDLRRVRVPRN